MIGPLPSFDVALVLRVGGDVVYTYGDVDRVFPLASVTKPIVAWSALVAVERGLMSLDDSAGPEGSSVRHLRAQCLGPCRSRGVAPSLLLRSAGSTQTRASTSSARWLRPRPASASPSGCVRRSLSRSAWRRPIFPVAPLMRALPVHPTSACSALSSRARRWCADLWRPSPLCRSFLRSPELRPATALQSLSVGPRPRDSR